ncbi:MAG: AAA family ATPase [Gemmatimonadota bacterium]
MSSRGQLELEAAVLGAFLSFGADELSIGPADVDARIFTSSHHLVVLSALRRMADRGSRIDVVGLLAQLAEEGQLEAAGGAACLAGLLDIVPTPLHLADHLAALRRRAQRRRVQDLLRECLSGIEEAEEPLEDVVHGIETGLASLHLDTGGAAILSLAEILEDPDVLSAPTPVVPNLAWEGRVTLLAAREKDGKSTLAGAAAAAKSGGHRFLGSPLAPGVVLYLGLEEHVGDFARRMVQFGADPKRVHLRQLVTSPLADLRASVRAVAPALVVLDTLAAFTESLDLDSGSAAAWTPIMTGIARVARESGAAVVLVHHGRKGGDGYRDSTAIGAGVDAILTLTTDQQLPPSHRVLTSKGRMDLRPRLTIELVEGEDGEPSYFRLAESELSLDARIVAFLEHNPESSQNAVREGVRAKNTEVGAAIRRLMAEGVVTDSGEVHRGRRLSVCRAAGPTAESDGNHNGTGLGKHLIPDDSRSPARLITTPGSEERQVSAGNHSGIKVGTTSVEPIPGVLPGGAPVGGPLEAAGDTAARHALEILDDE